MMVTTYHASQFHSIQTFKHTIKLMELEKYAEISTQLPQECSIRTPPSIRFQMNEFEAPLTQIALKGRHPHYTAHGALNLVPLPLSAALDIDKASARYFGRYFGCYSSSSTSKNRTFSGFGCTGHLARTARTLPRTGSQLMEPWHLSVPLPLSA